MATLLIGRITNLNRVKEYGYVRGEDGIDRFFHRNDLPRGVRFHKDLYWGDRVEFEPFEIEGSRTPLRAGAVCPIGPDEHDTDVVLMNVGPNRDEVIEALRSIPELGGTPENFVKNVGDPGWPAINVPLERAEAIKATLEAVGATVELEPND